MSAPPTESGFNRILQENASDTRDGSDISYMSLVEDSRRIFNTGITKTLDWRRQQLLNLKKLIHENHEAITNAIVADHGGPKFRGLFDLSGVSTDLEMALSNLEEWAGEEATPHDSMLGRSYVRREPKGVVLIIAPWNFPFAMVADVLVPVLAAGNCAVVKPSEVSQNTCKLIEDLFPKYFTDGTVKVVSGAVPETTALLREKFDHIMYTGNGAVARIVMQAASKNLTPVTLELGGKSPVYVDKSARLKVAVKRIATSKLMNAGQICIAPDYVMVHQDIAAEFKKEMVEFIKKGYGSSKEDREANKGYGRIINSRHVNRINSLLEGGSGKVLLGGSSKAEDRYFEPTIISDPSEADAVLKEEIFGPILPIATVAGVEEAAKKINRVCNRPLALYIFSEDQQAINYVLDHTLSGAVCVNSAIDQNSNRNLPFGGIGESGMGRYHGKWGFDEFSHLRAVYVKDTLLNRHPTLPPPPYGEKMYDLVLKAAVIGFFTDSQKKVMKYAGVGAAAIAGYKIFSKL